MLAPKLGNYINDYFKVITHGSTVWSGLDGCLMYCVHWKTLKARLDRKSLAERRPATGRNWKPVHPANKYIYYSFFGMLNRQNFYSSDKFPNKKKTYSNIYIIMKKAHLRKALRIKL